MKLNILLLEDDPKLANEIRQYFIAKNYLCDIAYDGKEVFKFIEQNKYDILILDINVPSVSGLEVCRRVRQEDKSIPILMLTAFGDVNDKVEALNIGADDYLVKPFHFDELTARINALIRRSGQQQTDLDDLIVIDDLTISPSQMTVSRSGRAIELTPKEFRLLELLAKGKGRPVSKQTILEQVWDINFDTGTNTIEVYINFLRNKIDKGHDEKLIHTRPVLAIISKGINGMNLKQRFSFSFSILYSVILATLLFFVYSMFANFRKEEIQNRLKEKAQTTLKLLVEVKRVDYQLLKLIDKNTINNLYNEKVLIFNDSFGLIYSSIDDAVINWDRKLLKRIQDEDYIYMTENEYDIVGIESTYQGKVYLVLISAEDKFGNRNLVYLKYLFLAAFVIGLVLVWLLSFYLSKEALTPLDVFKNKVQDISENNLSTRIEDKGRKDEITELTRAFNTMIDRIDKSFQYQKSFVGSASHELRTPLSKISAQLENLMENPDFPAKYIPILASINEDTQQLSDIVTSLLILSKLEKENPSKSFGNVRIDEIIFSSAEFLKKFYPDLKIHFEIINQTSADDKLEVRGDESLLKIAINNLLKNAYLYSDTKEVFIKIIQEDSSINLFFENTGKTPDSKNTYELFDPFVRGSNAMQSKGFGLGLSIVKRIIQYNEAEILYNINTPNFNQIKVTFKI